VEVVTTYRKWHAAARALDGLKLALFQNHLSVAEAHAASARVAALMSRWNQALGEYRIALAQEAWNVSLWMEYGRAAESAGRWTTAREAYAEAARAAPKDREIVQAIRLLDERMLKLRSAASGSMP
jgi:tetratricopeptide (TPR) repeat protein